MLFMRLFDSDLSEDGHVDGLVVDSFVISRFIYVDDWNSWRSGGGEVELLEEQ